MPVPEVLPKAKPCPGCGDQLMRAVPMPLLPQLQFLTQFPEVLLKAMSWLWRLADQNQPSHTSLSYFSHNCIFLRSSLRCCRKPCPGCGGLRMSSRRPRTCSPARCPQALAKMCWRALRRPRPVWSAHIRR
eukprot:1152217-Pelagomonas_calceolata.AAC.4